MNTTPGNTLSNDPSIETALEIAREMFESGQKYDFNEEEEEAVRQALEYLEDHRLSLRDLKEIQAWKAIFDGSKTTYIDQDGEKYGTTSINYLVEEIGQKYGLNEEQQKTLTDKLKDIDDHDNLQRGTKTIFCFYPYNSAKALEDIIFPYLKEQEKIQDHKGSLSDNYYRHAEKLAKAGAIMHTNSQWIDTTRAKFANKLDVDIDWWTDNASADSYAVAAATLIMAQEGGLRTALIQAQAAPDKMFTTPYQEYYRPIAKTDIFDNDGNLKLDALANALSKTSLNLSAQGFYHLIKDDKSLLCLSIQEAYHREMGHAGNWEDIWKNVHKTAYLELAGTDQWRSKSMQAQYDKEQYPIDTRLNGHLWDMPIGDIPMLMKMNRQCISKEGQNLSLETFSNALQNYKTIGDILEIGKFSVKFNPTFQVLARREYISENFPTFPSQLYNMHILTSKLEAHEKGMIHDAFNAYRNTKLNEIPSEYREFMLRAKMWTMELNSPEGPSKDAHRKKFYDAYDALNIGEPQQTAPRQQQQQQQQATPQPPPPRQQPRQQQQQEGVSGEVYFNNIDTHLEYHLRKIGQLEAFLQEEKSNGFIIIKNGDDKGFKIPAENVDDLAAILGAKGLAQLYAGNDPGGRLLNALKKYSGQTIAGQFQYTATEVNLNALSATPDTSQETSQDRRDAFAQDARDSIPPAVQPLQTTPLPQNLQSTSPQTPGETIP